MNASRLIIRISGLILAVVSGLPLLPLLIVSISLGPPRRYHYYYFAPTSSVGASWMSFGSPAVFAIACSMLVFSFARVGKSNVDQLLLRSAGTAIALWSGIQLLTGRMMSFEGESSPMGAMTTESWSKPIALQMFLVIGVALILFSYLGSRNDPTPNKTESDAENPD